MQLYTHIGPTNVGVARYMLVRGWLQFAIHSIPKQGSQILNLCPAALVRIIPVIGQEGPG